MNRFLFFTRTDWKEIPRLRHQLAHLLSSYGNDIIFFEKPDNLFITNKIPASNYGRIKFYRTKQLAHPRLRVNKFLRIINKVYEMNQIRKGTKYFNITNNDVIVNFNYYYYFLRELFPSNKIITIINDYHWYKTIFGFQKPLINALSLTCKNSDVVLTVSYPLIEQLSSFCNPKLFLPWTEYQYNAPDMSIKKNRLLFWGGVNNRLNFEYISKLANGLQKLNMNITLDFVGPIERRIDTRFKELILHPNVNVQGPERLEMLNMDTVLGAFIPYVEGNKTDDVTTIPNKAFPMLAYGLPLLITGMPNFINEPFVFRIGENISKDIKLLGELNNRLTGLQESISAFVKNNTGQCRYDQFIKYI